MSVLDAWLSERGAKTVLDFGCGDGSTVKRLCSLGYDAWGCDLSTGYETDRGGWRRFMPGERWTGEPRLRPISAKPYRLPFDDASFDAVISNQVMEHVQNKTEVFSEFDRVLKPGGASAHLFPPKWSFPVEHHIYVPFVSWMWPHVPNWYLRMWAALGVRNRFQRGMSAAKVAKNNIAFCKEGICYWSRGQYEQLAPERIAWTPAFYVRHAEGRAVRLARTLHVPSALVALFHGDMMVVRRLNSV